MQYVIFRIGENLYSINSKKVSGIDKIPEITPIPLSHKAIKGLINLRGNIKVVIDTGIILKMETSTNYRKIITVNYKDDQVGLLIEEVVDVIEIKENIIQTINKKQKEDIIEVIKLQNNFAVMIDIDKALDQLIN